jgi:hypothetical protein
MAPVVWCSVVCENRNLEFQDDNTGAKISTDNDEYIVAMNLIGKK